MLHEDRVLMLFCLWEELLQSHVMRFGMLFLSTHSLHSSLGMLPIGYWHIIHMLCSGSSWVM